MFIWCEWICTHCQEIHRKRFEIAVDLKAVHQLRGNLYEKEGVFIEDLAFDTTEKPSKKPRRKVKTRIHVKWDTQISQIVKAVKDYMPQYHAIRQGSLKVEVCRG